MINTADLRRRIEEEGAEILRIMGERFPLFADVLESDEEVLVIIDMPGCVKETIDVRYDEHQGEEFGGVLSVEGRRRKPLEPGFRYIAESRPDFISGEIPIHTPVNYDDSSASYEEGLLKVRLPRKEIKELSDN